MGLSTSLFNKQSLRDIAGFHGKYREKNKDVHCSLNTLLEQSVEKHEKDVLLFLN